jgi:hypothetical protein
MRTPVAILLAAILVVAAPVSVTIAAPLIRSIPA